MKQKSLIAIMLIAVVTLLAGCRFEPVHNVKEAPLNIDRTVHGSEDVHRAIMRAGGTMGWDMEPQEPGHVVGTLSLRDHVAVVDVTYDEETYSITYKDSVNLDYDGRVIHQNYNGWIQNLDRAIRVQLQTL